MDQIEYLDILFRDCGFDGAARRAWLFLEYKVKYTDELGKGVRSALIDRLKQMKEDRKIEQR